MKRDNGLALLAVLLLFLMLYVGSYVFLRGRPAMRTTGPLDLETMHEELIGLGPLIPGPVVKPANIFYAPCRFADKAVTGLEITFEKDYRNP